MEATPTAPRDGLLPPEDWTVELSAFEGPLDLLLFLLRRHEVDIYDIPIAKVTAQYLSFLRAAQERQLEVAGEFFVLAATLMRIKSRALLPVEELKPEDPAAPEVGQDPRWELVQQLIEYQRFKDAASELGVRLETHAQSLPRRVVAPAKAETPPRPLKPLDRLELWAAFNRVLTRLSDRIIVGEVQEEAVTVASRMELVLARLKKVERVSLFALLAEAETTVNVAVATFLALLELTRLQQVALVQTADFEDVEILQNEPEILSETASSAQTRLPSQANH